MVKQFDTETPTSKNIIIRTVLAICSITTLLLALAKIITFFRLSLESSIGEQLLLAPLYLTLLATLAGSSLSLLLIIRSWQEKGGRSFAIFLTAVPAA